MSHLVDRIFAQSENWLIGIGVLALLVGSLLLGNAVHRRRHKGDEPHGESSSQEGNILAGAMGLLALLLGFTFAMAIDRYDDRRSLVVVEANAIGTTYLRAQLLDEPHRARLSELLKTYSETRIALATSHDRNERQRLMAKSDGYQHQLWAETVAAIQPIRDVEIASTFVTAMNETIDAGAARVAARRAHVPSQVMLALLLYMAVAAFMLGYVMSNSRRRGISLLELGLITLAYMLIIDIDQPTAGAIREPQEPMVDLLAMMKASPPDSFGATAAEAPPQ